MNKKKYRFITSVIDLIKSVSSEYGVPVGPSVMVFVACQSALETAYGTSHVYLDNHNLFGMRYPKSRINLALNEHLGHACYVSDRDSVVDYLFLWCSFNKFIASDLLKSDAFITKLSSSGFNPSSKYIDTIISIYKSYKNYDNEQEED